MSTFPTMQDVEKRFKKEEEERKMKNKSKPYMEFRINSHLLKEERIDEVANDIVFEYPEICKSLREEIAKMEEPIYGCHEDYELFYQDELRVKRLFNILKVLYERKGFNEVYERAYQDIKKSYNVYLEHFTYANPGSSKVSAIMRVLKDFTNDQDITIPEY